jgi:hypothetical protein
MCPLGPECATAAFVILLPARCHATFTFAFRCAQFDSKDGGKPSYPHISALQKAALPRTISRRDK